MIRIIESDSHNPYYNIALEEVLLHACEQSQDFILYLWQNDNTIVIGRNQTVYTECDLNRVDSEGIFVVRRLSGGGTVYHDLGNLNFTVIVPKKFYDKAVSLQVIVNALNTLGIPASVNGRNDIVYDNFKLSGNAYYSSACAGLHHGTIMFDVNLDKMQRLLYTSQGKMAKKGVCSVKSRVVNLKTINSDITLEKLKAAIESSFTEAYGKKWNIDRKLNTTELEEIFKLQCKYESEEWNMRQVEDYDIQIEEKFEWGFLKLTCCMSGKKIDKISLISDSLYPDLIDELTDFLNNRRKSSFAHLEDKVKAVTEKEIIIATEKMYRKLLKMC